MQAISAHNISSRLIGMTVRQAGEALDTANLRFRCSSIDGMPIPADPPYLPRCVSLSIEGDVVVGAAAQ